MTHFNADIMQEYRLDKMKLVGTAEEILHTPASNFMPHPEVLRQKALTTRLRVVFNCLACITTG